MSRTSCVGGEVWDFDQVPQGVAGEVGTGGGIFWGERSWERPVERTGVVG